MTPVPIDLPLRPSEAAEVANLVFDQAERKPLTDEIRNRIAARGAALRLTSLRPWFGSLERDPVHPSAYYLAVDAIGGPSLLLHLALATCPTSSIFTKPLLIGRMRRANGPEMVINAIPFAPPDLEQIENFCNRLSPAFQPRPHGPRTAISVSGDRPDLVSASAFTAFSAIRKRTGKNLASLGPAPLEHARETYCAGVWAAVRSGWREGYSAAVTVKIPRDGLAETRDAVRQAPPFSQFVIDPSAWFTRSPEAAALESAFEGRFSPEERGWIFDEFARSFEMGGIAYAFTPDDVMRLAIEFGSALRMVEEFHELIRQAKAHAKTARPFDLELLLDHMPPATTPQQLLFCLHWLRQRGHSAQLVSPRPAPSGDLVEQMTPMAAIAMHYQARLSIDASLIHTPDVVDRIARAGSGRLQWRIIGTAHHVTSTIQSLAEQFIA